VAQGLRIEFNAGTKSRHVCTPVHNVLLLVSQRLRQRQMRNMSMALMMAHGVPMLTMGDEYGHTKGGNNNTYCHDNQLNWLDWREVNEDSAGFLRFMRHLVALRRARPELQRATFVNANDVQWHGEQPDAPDWTPASRLVAYTVNDGAGGGLFVAFNTSHLPKVLCLPKWGDRVWQPLVDTGKVAPYDVLIPDEVSLGGWGASTCLYACANTLSCSAYQRSQACRQAFVWMSRLLMITRPQHPTPFLCTQTLPAEEVERVRAMNSQWTAERAYAILPWSAIILEAVPEHTSHIAAKIQAAAPPASISYN
jgi:hypothetical protein